MISAEFEMIAEPTDGLVPDSDVQLGPGDDATVLVPHGDIVVTTNVLIENIRSKRAWSSAFQTGKKAMTIDISDIEAMGIELGVVVIGLTFPGNLDRRQVSDFQEGMIEEYAWIRISLVGGDLSSSVHIALGVTALGNLPGRPAVTRTDARADDQVAVYGRLGYSAGGLLALQRGFGSLKDLVLEQQCPTVPCGQGKVAVGAGATTTIDISDGLLQDLRHTHKLSGMGIDMRTGALKIHDSLARLTAATGKDPLGFIFAGGEDYVLAMTSPAEAEPPQDWLRIGTVTAGARVVVGGMPWTGSIGWDHSARKESQ